MNAGRKNSSLNPQKRQNLQGNPKTSDVCRLFVALILKFQSMIFQIPQRTGVDKIRLAGILKIHLGVEVDNKIENLAAFIRRAHN